MRDYVTTTKKKQEGNEKKSFILSTKNRNRTQIQQQQKTSRVTKRDLSQSVRHASCFSQKGIQIKQMKEKNDDDDTTLRIKRNARDKANKNAMMLMKTSLTG